jgi:hypothetical protein
VPDRIRFDHLAIAAERWADLFPRYVGELGGRFASGGRSPGFAPAQLAYRNGTRLELLEPNAVEQNDFLRRFLDRSGPGPHHLTFKVPDLDAALAAAEGAGLHPIGVDRSDPHWQEAFLHPREALGVVVQLAQTPGDHWETPRPPGVPLPPEGRTAAFVHVAHAVAALDEGLALFSELLGGRTGAEGRGRGHRFVDLEFEGPLRLRLLAPDSEGSGLWPLLAGRRGKVHHLAFACPDPAAVRDARPVASGRAVVVDPERNLGVRLVLASLGDPAAEPGGAAFADAVEA